MAYSTTWFDQNARAWMQYLRHLKGKEHLSFLELGCFEGRATVWLLENILTHPTSTITVVDTFLGSPEFLAFKINATTIEAEFTENIAPFKSQVIVKKGKTNQIRYWRQKYDVIYIDASHTALDVLRDGMLSFDLVKQGGSIIFDDFNWDAGTGECNRPHEAITTFLHIWGGYYGEWTFWQDQAAFRKLVV